jgi:hypothetical protein
MEVRLSLPADLPEGSSTSVTTIPLGVAYELKKS